MNVKQKIENISISDNPYEGYIPDVSEWLVGAVARYIYDDKPYEFYVLNECRLIALGRFFGIENKKLKDLRENF